MHEGLPEMVDLIPPEWRPSEKYITICARCGKEILKRNAPALYVKKSSYAPLRVLLHFCETCYYNFLEDYEIPEV